mgnify:CR=1 FL=1
MADPSFLLDSQVPSPCFVIDLDRLRQNARVLAGVQERTGARIFLALKGYACPSTFPLLSRALGRGGPLYGTCASSVDEARLGREEFGGKVEAFAAAWSEDEMRELVTLADTIVFNSVAQWHRFRDIVKAAPRSIECGLRINPEHSEGTVPIYDPCSPISRLGIRRRDLPDGIMSEGISGLHFHTLCEQGADALARTVEAVEKNFAPFLEQCSWINCGGGHHITRPGYALATLENCILSVRQKYGVQVYLEPGEAWALNAGYLVTTVLDTLRNGDTSLAILDMSAACHTPDVIEMPYRPPLLDAGEAGEKAHTVRLGGPTCLAGDIIGDYSFDAPLAEGDKLIFGDMAIYTTCKNNTFNGMPLPPIWLLGADGNCRELVHFGYQDFKMRLGAQ